MRWKPRLPEGASSAKGETKLDGGAFPAPGHPLSWRTDPCSPSCALPGVVRASVLAVPIRSSRLG